jgi:PAS domain S-box-containing protein
MADLTRQFHWERTVLGPIESWPDELISTVNLLLASSYPMFLWWGPELIQFYNDAYRPSIREDKHPSALGQRGKECWEEAWPIIGSEIERGLGKGESIWNVNRQVPILRNGRIEEVYWTYSYSPVRDREGRVEGVLACCNEVPNDRCLQKELEESKREAQQQWAELEAIYRTAPIALALFDPVEFRYLRLNHRQAEIVGLPAEEILGKTLTEIAPIAGLREMFEQVALGKPVINALLEGELPMSPGEHRYWTVNYFPVYDADGSIKAISAASLEITAQKRAEMALIQSEKIAAVGRLASAISHEINNPLEAVTNLLFLLQSENLSPDGREYLASAERELARVSHIATHTLRFHRQSTKAIKSGTAEMIDPILALHKGRISLSEITIEKDYRTNAKVLCFDGEIRQVLNNLIGNAIDAMWRGGRLVLRSRLATNWRDGEKGLCITIADTGHGMNEVTKRRLFEAFFTTKGANGTGLGLWISSEIVRKHGGLLRFQSSRKEGRSGTVFQLFLPLQPAILEKLEAVRTQST